MGGLGGRMDADGRAWGEGTVGKRGITSVFSCLVSEIMLTSINTGPNSASTCGHIVETEMCRVTSLICDVL